MTRYTLSVYTESMDTRLALLGLVEAGSEYGYNLKNNWDQWFKESKPIAFGQIYATLSRLNRDGLITTDGSEAGDGPARKRYKITKQGREEVDRWLFTPQAPSASAQAEIFAKTIIALMLNLDAAKLLDEQRLTLIDHMRKYTRAKRNAPLTGVLIADHAIFHLEADLRWIELTAARLDELQKEVKQ